MVRTSAQLYSRLVAITFALLVPAAFSQVQQQPLTASMKGDDARSLITVGETGAPVGYNAPYPVNTLVYPDGQIVYRVEWAMMRGEVGQMQKSFGQGTSFQITGVDFKNDCLELKLLSRNGGSAHLKVMFGAGWQTRMTNDSVIQTVEKFLSLPTGQPTNVAGASRSSPSNPTPQSSGAIVPVAKLYSRQAGVAEIPGRISEVDLQSILASLQRREQDAPNRLFRAASFFAQAFRTAEDAFSRFRLKGPVQEIESLRNGLGSDFIPRTPEDITELNKVYEDCTWVAHLNQSANGPGANSPIYQHAFLSSDAQAMHDESIEELRAALQNAMEESAQIASAEMAIIQIEQALDKGDLLDASKKLSSLFKTTVARLPETTKYLDGSTSLRIDLESYSKVNSAHAAMAPSLPQRLYEIADEDSNLEKEVAEPITSSYLHQVLIEDKDKLKAQLSALPAFRSDLKPFDSETDDHRANLLSNAKFDAANIQLEQIRSELRTFDDLSKITADKKAMQLIRNWFGEGTAASLIEKSAGLKAAWEGEARLSGYIEAAKAERKLQEDLRQAKVAELQRLRDQEEALRQAKVAELQRLHDQEQARKQALIDERNSLAERIVTSALTVTMLDEQFQLTEILGYKMEAEKRREELSNLIRKDDAMLTPSLWAEVHANVDRLLPGLTVWRANHLETIIGGLR